MTQFLITANSTCVSASNKKIALTPTEKILLPTTPPEAPKQESNLDKPAEAPISPAVSPVQALPAPTATLSADTLFSLVNSHRAEIGLASFEHDAQVCSVAQSRAQEIPQEIFVTHQLHAGFYAKNLPYYATENLIWQHTEAEALNWWLHSPIHRAAIEGNYKYACGVCTGEVCNMVFTNYEQKIIASSSAQLALTK